MLLLGFEIGDDCYWKELVPGDIFLLNRKPHLKVAWTRYVEIGNAGFKTFTHLNSSKELPMLNRLKPNFRGYSDSIEPNIHKLIDIQC